MEQKPTEVSPDLKTKLIINRIKNHRKLKIIITILLIVVATATAVMQLFYCYQKTTQKNLKN